MERAADDQTFVDAVEGYAGTLSVAPGERVPLHLSTTVVNIDGRDRVERITVAPVPGVADD